MFTSCPPVLHVRKHHRCILARFLASSVHALPSHRGRAVTAKEEETISGKEALVVCVGLLISFLSILVLVCTPCAFLE